MKRTFLMLATGILLVTSSAVYAQQKLTEEQAMRLVQEYANREEAACAKIKEEEEKIEELTKTSKELDERLNALASEMTRAKAAAAAEPDYDTYVVRAGDWLAKLAEYPDVYGHGNYAMWPRIYEANRDLIKKPTLIRPGWELKIPRD
jgi:nucleoid-associated protein YgaU